ncbi:MAG: M14 family metallocarboxypeptidase [Pseudomonadota bacterium]
MQNTVGAPYPIGTPDQPWGSEERREWRERQSKQRSYSDDVLLPLGALEERFAVENYGQLSYTEGRYPLLGVVTPEWDAQRPCVLVTGGVHGYETSGVHGALRFVSDHAERYASVFNIAAAPCVSPWGYETINRWNPETTDPNRSFTKDSASEEAVQLMRWVSRLPGRFLAHFDLHETTDTDNSEFRPALAARDGVTLDVWAIPDGFYLVGDSQAPAPEFQRAIIDAVRGVTHIAPADASGCIIGAPVEQPGVINYEVAALGLCAGITDAPYRTTTEMYPDSPDADDETCVNAQVTAVCAGLDYLRSPGSGAL